MIANSVLVIWVGRAVVSYLFITRFVGLFLPKLMFNFSRVIGLWFLLMVASEMGDDRSRVEPLFCGN